VCVCVCLSFHVCMFVDTFLCVSLTCSWFPYERFILRAFATDINNQLTWKCIKTCHAVFVLDMASRLVDNVFYVKLTEDQVWISLKRTSIYFPRVIFHPHLPLPPLLKSSQKFTFVGQMVISPLPAKAEGDYSFRFRLSVRHNKILSCSDFFLRPLIYWLDIWYVAISRWVTV
jgi:hypothetical protein